MSIRAGLALAAVVAAASLAAPARAATVFIGLDNAFMPSPAPLSDAARSAFLGAAGPVALQDFESAALGDLGASTPGVFANGVGVTLVNGTSSVGSSAGSHLRIAAGTSGFDTYPTSGRRFLDGLSGPGSTYFTATFDVLIGAIGFDYTDASDWSGTGGTIPPLTALVTFGDGSTLEVDLADGQAPSSLVDGNRGFVGIVEPTLGIRSIALRSGAAPDADAIGIDDVRVGLLVPEPAPLALLALAAVLAAAQRRVQRGATVLRTR